MKKTILTIILFIVLFNTQAQEQLHSMVEEWYRNGTWEVDEGHNYYYDQNGNIKSVVYLKWNTSQWENSYRSLFEYNANNTIAHFTYQDWSVNNYENEDRYVFMYKPNDDQVEELILQTWNGIQWVVGARYVFSYNPAGRIIESRLEEWNGQWENIERQTFDYSNGTTLILEKWDGIQWLVYQKKEYTHNIDGRVISEKWSDWAAGQWQENRSFDRQYDAIGNLLQEEKYVLGELEGRDECQYDLSKELSDIDYFFEEPFLNEVLNFPNNFPYVNKVLTRTTLNYNKSTNRFDTYRREVYNYEQGIMTSSQGGYNQKKAICIYPSLAESQIKIDGANYSGAHYLILDMTGKPTFQGKVDQHNSLRVDGLPLGNYILMLDDKRSFKFIKK